MQRVLLTGLSGTGKSTLIETLAGRGYRAVDLDGDDYSEWAAREDPPASANDVERVGVWQSRDWVWRADRVARLLASDDTPQIFIGGSAPNQGKFYPQLEHVILLSAPAEVLAERLRTRTTNAYGKRPEQLARVLAQIESVEPLLRRGVCFEVDASAPLEHVTASILGHLRI